MQHVLITLTLLGVVLATPAQTELPDFGDSSQSVLSQANEEKLGEAFFRKLRRQVTIVDDPEVESYIQNIGYRLASNTKQDEVRFTFFVVDDPSVNAFAGPGGFIGINSGLITTAQSESELAAVLAHEIAHVTQRHISRTIELREQTSAALLAGLAAAILLGTQHSEAGAASAAVLQGRAAQSFLDFSRANELEADRISIELMAAAGLDPRAVPQFFERLQEMSKYSTQSPEFLSTHPVTTARIAESRARADIYPFRQHTSSIGFYLIRSKLQVSAHKSAREALVQFEKKLASGKYISELGANYGLTLSLLNSGNLDRAAIVIEKLIAKHPERISFYDTSAKIETKRGNLEKALLIYEDNLELYPDSKVLVRGYTEVLILNNRPQAAISQLEQYSKHHSLDGRMYQLAARAHKETGNARGAHAALAEYYYHEGLLSEAAHQLELAARAPGHSNFYTNSRIEARLEEINREKSSGN